MPSVDPLRVLRAGAAAGVVAGVVPLLLMACVVCPAVAAAAGRCNADAPFREQTVFGEQDLRSSWSSDAWVWDADGDGRTDVLELTDQDENGAVAFVLLGSRHTNNIAGRSASSWARIPLDSFSVRALVTGNVAGDAADEVVWLTSRPEVRVASLDNSTTPLRFNVTALPLPDGYENSYGLAVADINGDGKSDVVSAVRYTSEASSSSSSSYMLGIVAWAQGGDGALGPAAVIGSPEAVLSTLVSMMLGADLNGDGADDTVLVATSRPTLIYLSMAGGPALAAPVDLGSKTLRLAAAGDFDGDGDVDIVGYDSYNRDVLLFANDGSGGFSGSSMMLYDGTITALTAGDADADGRDDVLVMRSGATAPVDLYRNVATWPPVLNMTLATYLPSTPGMLELVDFWEPGRPAIVAGGADVLVGEVSALASGAYPEYLSFNGRTPFTTSALVDVTGDGVEDLVVSDGGSGGTVIWLLKGTGERGGGAGGPLFEVARIAGFDPDEWTRDLALGDVNGDEHLDAVVVTRKKIFWHANGYVATGGDVVFTNRTYVATTGGKYMTSIKIVDLDGNGLNDLVLCAKDTVGWVPAWGVGGGFESSRRLISSAVVWPDLVVTGDFNSDGTVDLVVSRSGTTPNVRVWYNASVSGTSNVLTNMMVDVRDMAVGDVTGDGIDDLVMVSEDDSQVGWAAGAAGLGLGPVVMLSTLDNLFADSVSIGDVNQDGYLDVLLGSSRDDRAYALLNAVGNMSLITQVLMSDVTMYQTRPIVRGTTGPGEPGFVLLADYGPPRVATIPNPTRNLTLRRTTSPEYASLDSMVCGDISGDVYPDCIGFGSESIQWKANDGAGRLGAARDVGLGSGVVVLFDMDGDGDLDVITVAYGLLVWVPNVDGQGLFDFEARVTMQAGADGYAVLAVYDVDSDGVPDMVVGDNSADGVGAVAVLSRPPGSTSYTRSAVGQAPMDVLFLSAGDFNGDGATDIAAGYDGWDGLVTVCVYSGSGGVSFGGVYANITTRVYSSLTGLDVGDLTGDGASDLMLSYYNERVVVHINNGDNTFSAAQTVTTQEVGTASLMDVNGDGVLDIVHGTDYYSSGGNLVQLLINNGAGLFEKDTWFDGAVGWGMVQAHDMDLDGVMDLVSLDEVSLTQARMMGFVPTARTIRLEELAGDIPMCNGRLRTMGCITAAMEHLSSCVRDTLVLPAGTYACRSDGHVQVDQRVRFAARPARSVVFDCSGAGGLFRVVDGGDVELEGIVVRGGGAARATLYAVPVLRVEGTGSRLALFNSEVVDSQSLLFTDDRFAVDVGLGGAVSASLGGLFWADAASRLAGNRASLGGGAIYGRGAGTSIILAGTAVTDNSAGRGGGILVEYGAVVELESGTVVAGNTADEEGGGGVFVDQFSRATSVGAAIVDNTASGTGAGGGMQVRGGAVVQLTSTRVSGNRAGSVGGGVAVLLEDVAEPTRSSESVLDLPAAPASMASEAGLGSTPRVELVSVNITGDNTAGLAGPSMYVCGVATAVKEAGPGGVYVCALEGTPMGNAGGADKVAWLRPDAAAWTGLGAWIGAPPVLLEMVTPPAERSAAGTGLGGSVRLVNWLGFEVGNEPTVGVRLVVDGQGAAVATGQVETVMSSAVQDLASVVVQVQADAPVPLTLSWRVEVITSSGSTSYAALPISDVTGSLVVEACGPGTGTVLGTVDPYVVCSECPEGSASLATDLQACVPLQVCPANTIRLAATANTSSVDCVCEAGFWTPTGQANVACPACPRGGVCPGGLEPPVAAPGFYPESGGSTLFLKCALAEACIGNGKCATGYTAQLCGKCADGWYKLGSRCHKCDTSKNALIVVALLVVLTAAIAVLVAFSLMESVRYKFAAAMIGLNSLQITAMYGQLELDWGEFARVYFDVASALNVDLELTSPECAVVSGVDVWVLKWVLTLLLPVFVCAGVSLVGLVYAGVVATGLGSRVPFLRNQSMASLAMGCVRTMFQIVVLLYLPLARAAFAPFSCRKDESGRWVMDPDPSRSCYNTAWWSGLFVPALAAIVVYAVGLPAAVLGVLTRMRRRLDPVTYTLRFGFLVGRFVDEAWWFEAALMARKVGVVLCMTLFFADSSKANSAAVLLMCSLGHLVFSQPYRSGFHNGLAVFVLGMTSLVLYAGTFADFTLRRTCVVMGVVGNVLAILIGNGIDIWLIARDEAQAEKDADASEFDGQTVELADVVESSMVHETALDDRARGESISQAIVVDEVVSFQQPVFVDSGELELLSTQSSTTGAVAVEAGSGGEPQTKADVLFMMDSARMGDSMGMIGSFGVMDSLGSVDSDAAGAGY